MKSDVLQVIEDIDEKLTIEKNFKVYRSMMETVTPPCIPYLGMYQKDIFFLNDGNPDRIGQLINFNKRTKIAEVAFDLSFCKKGSYQSLNPSPGFISWFFSSSPNLSEKDLYLWSRRVDPKDPEMVIAELITSEITYLKRIAELEKELEREREEKRQLQKSLSERKPWTSADHPSDTAAEHKSILGSTSWTQDASGLEFVEVNPSNSVTNPPPSTTEITPPPVQSILSKYQNRIQVSYSLIGTHQNLLNDQDPSKWSVNEVCEWIADLVGPEWVIPFMDNQILGADLLEMGTHELSLFVRDVVVCANVYAGIQNLRQVTENLRNTPLNEQQSATEITNVSDPNQNSTRRPFPAPPKPAKPLRSPRNLLNLTSTEPI